MRNSSCWKSFAPVSLVALGTVVLGCSYTTTNVVRVRPLDTEYPVSASSRYRDSNRRVVSEENYRVVRRFEFEREVEGDLHDTSETNLVLEPELNRLVAENEGDAITQFKLEGYEYDVGDHGGRATDKYLIWTCGIIGGIFLAEGLFNSKLEEHRGTWLAIGGGSLGLAGLGVLSLAFDTDPATWRFKVSGQVVKHKESSARPAPKPATVRAKPTTPAPGTLPAEAPSPGAASGPSLGDTPPPAAASGATPDEPPAAASSPEP
jgi:hypothetical protein